MRPWRVEHRAGGAAELHARPVDPGPGRLVEVLRVERRALVLGSTQDEAIVDHEAAEDAETDVVRRRSGGGAVLLEPGGSTWIDVTIARDDPLWSDDVALAFTWIGRAWVEALAALGVDGWMHRGALVETPWSRRVCFAGLGPGEVVVGDRKLVGISQRRTREGARFQCVVHRTWQPVSILALLDLDERERSAGARELAGVATGLEIGETALVSALVAALPE